LKKLLVVSLLALCSSTAEAQVPSIDGVWQVTVQDTATNNNLLCPLETNVLSVSISVTGSAATLTLLDGSGAVLSGTVVGSQLLIPVPPLPEDGGFTSNTGTGPMGEVVLTITGTTMAGTSTWMWCSGAPCPGAIGDCGGTSIWTAALQFAELCNGDGGVSPGCTDCPCTNNAPTGTVGGCLNSAGTSARLLASGDPSASLTAGITTDLRFGLEGAPPNAFCILNSGSAVAPQGLANPCFGLNSGAQALAFDGLRCAVQGTRRHGGRSADGLGRVGVTNNPWGGEGGPPVGIAQAGAGFVAGQTRYFQVINRDDALLSCMRGLNTSQAVRVIFTL